MGHYCVMVHSLRTVALPVDHPRTIAVVDDDEASRDSLACLLDSLGEESCAFESGDLFLLSRDRNRHAGVILDIHMPGADGIEVTRRIRADGFQGPVVLITGRPDSVVREAGKAAGATAVFAKPLPEHELLAMLTAPSGSDST